MAVTEIHPSELAYALACARTENVIGWDSSAFQPAGAETVDFGAWLKMGEGKLCAAGRLVGEPAAGLNFTEEVGSAILALADPALVLLAERKSEGGLRRLSIHARADDFVGLRRRPDHLFEITRYAELTAAAGASAGFLGATFSPVSEEVRLDAELQDLSGLRQAAQNGDGEGAARQLVALGMDASAAQSAASALSTPVAAGTLTACYCAGNEVQDAEAISVFTNADDETWLLFAPASLSAPLVLERSSVSALAARVTVDVAARWSVKASSASHS